MTLRADMANMISTQIAVIGGGAAGCMAAIAAAQQGARVLLIERSEHIGRKLAATGNGRCNLTNLTQNRDCYHTNEEADLSAFFIEFCRVMEHSFLPLRDDQDDNREWISCAGVCADPDRMSAGDPPQLQFDEAARRCAADLIAVFREFGVYCHDRGGYVYPRTEQAGTIVHALERQLRLQGVDIRCGCTVYDILREDNVNVTDSSPEMKAAGRDHRITDDCSAAGFLLRTSAGIIHAERVVLACGGAAGPQLGATSDGYKLAAQLGHSCIAPVPALTSLLTKDQTIRAAAGVRCDASVRIEVDDTDAYPPLPEDDGTYGSRVSFPNIGFLSPAGTERGELQITDSGISGIPVFQVSRFASRALHDGKTVTAIIDFLPEFDTESWESVMASRMQQLSEDDTLAEVFSGLVHPKIASWILRRYGFAGEKKLRNLMDTDAGDLMRELLQALRCFPVRVIAAGGYEKAQVTSGGVPLGQMKATMESWICPGFYLAGEVLDVDGACGGYNLTFAFAGGLTAGVHAAS